MPKVSVIIPVYNTEKYLKKCLDSIVAQTLQDIEILCIDDGSTDSSLEILWEYARKDARFKIYQNLENKGLSYTRNVGMDHACGEYIQFVDSDDWIEPDTMERLYTTANDNQLDLLKYLSNRLKKDLFSDSIANKVFPTGRDMLISLICQPYSGVGVWILFLNRSFIEKNHLRFAPEVRYGEDVLFTFQTLLSAQKCMCVNERKYIYSKREGSLVTGSLSDEKLFFRVYVLKELLKIISGNYKDPDFCQAQLAYFIMCCEAIKEEMDKRLEQPDIETWEPELQRVYQMFFSGDGWVTNLISRKKLSVHRAEIFSASQIYIFGAGNAAQRLIQILSRAGIEIDGVIVSDKAKNRKSVYGYPVFSMDEIPLGREQSLILSAVKGTHPEIGELLNEHGFYNVINVCQ